MFPPCFVLWPMDGTIAGWVLCVPCRESTSLRRLKTRLPAWTTPTCQNEPTCHTLHTYATTIFISSNILTTAFLRLSSHAKWYCPSSQKQGNWLRTTPLHYQSKPTHFTAFHRSLLTRPSSFLLSIFVSAPLSNSSEMFLSKRVGAMVAWPWRGPRVSCAVTWRHVVRAFYLAFRENLGGALESSSIWWRRD